MDGFRSAPHRLAAELMAAFAARTGLTEDQAPVRYLWTDAFATCTMLGLARSTDDPAWRHLALRLVDHVHSTLGRHRPDDARSGWISGLADSDGARHPTAGGLRIGKRLPERTPDDPPDPAREWDRDGQYFHYLTRWMHALARVHEEVGDPRALSWAVELARAAHRAFVVRDAAGQPVRMVWKTSVDLTRALVGSMGQHDPIDGLVVYRELQVAGGGGLGAEVDEMRRLAGGALLPTDDPLGIGGLLVDAWQLARTDPRAPTRDELAQDLLAAALDSLRWLAAEDAFRGGAESRVAFRELGLAIGFHAVERLADLSDALPEVEQLLSFAPLAAGIEAFWSDPANRRASTWRDHLDINDVMLATSLAPSGHLGPRADRK